MTMIASAMRFSAASMLLCAGLYTLTVFGVARLASPAQAEGSLVRRADGTVVGSSLLAQAFHTPRYFWPRPSACGYDAAAGAGSNLSPNGDALAVLAQQRVAAAGATADRPLPADLAAASGSGLDPHISLAAARFQIPRIAAARGVPEARVAALVERLADAAAWPFASDRIVEVLALNLALDADT